jgi:hypothetical protein
MSEARRAALDRSGTARVERLGNGDLAPPARPTMSPIASAIPTRAMRMRGTLCRNAATPSRATACSEIGVRSSR